MMKLQQCVCFSGLQSVRCHELKTLASNSYVQAVLTPALHIELRN